MYVLIHAHPDEDVRRHDGALTHGRLALENRQEHLVDLVVKPLRLHRHPDRPLHRPLKAIGGLQHVPLHLLVRGDLHIVDRQPHRLLPLDELQPLEQLRLAPRVPLAELLQLLLQRRDRRVGRGVDLHLRRGAGAAGSVGGGLVERILRLVVVVVVDDELEVVHPDGGGAGAQAGRAEGGEEQRVERPSAKSSRRRGVQREEKHRGARGARGAGWGEMAVG
mmetsp:Transcript_9094/g.18999  ORF Transcript_9094/g.18999 Transcript_9094/m.18999 type:complete len:221 (-) Transcript_9094:111-773(-)